MDIELENISKTYGDRIVLDHFNNSFTDGMIHGIVGPSGSGKTTLLNIIVGFIKPDTGLIRGVEGKKVGFVFQDMRLLPWKTAHENIRFVLKEEENENIEMYMKLLKIWEYKDYYPKQLSGGTKQRLEIARMLCYNPEILIMDEPFNALDGDIKQSIISELRDIIKKQKKTVIVSTHDEYVVQNFCDQVLKIGGV